MARGRRFESRRVGDVWRVYDVNGGTARFTSGPYASPELAEAGVGRATKARRALLREAEALEAAE